MIMKTYERIYGISEIESVAESLQPLLTRTAVMTFTGPLGAGKTTLIRAICQKAGVKENVNSPTFTYLNIYHADSGLAFYHFDLYRIRTLDDFLFAGFDEYLFQPNSKALIEWPEVIMPLLTHDTCHITIDYHGLEERQLKCLGS